MTSGSNSWEELLFDSSRQTADMAVNHIGSNPELFNKLVDFALLDRGQFAMRAARVMNLLTLQYPHLIRPHLKMLIWKLPEIKNDGLKRGIAKTLTERSVDYDEETMSVLVDCCFGWLHDPQEKVALKYYAMDILYKITLQYPELENELINTIELHIPEASSAIKGRGEKILKKLQKRNLPS
ncbi:MAG: hypothetical protein KDC05_03160 [Bacteroidales bacterium]|nr:hypothetical protein [Bacteroidales bacterium]